MLTSKSVSERKVVKILKLLRAFHLFKFFDNLYWQSFAVLSVKKRFLQSKTKLVGRILVEYTVFFSFIEKTRQQLYSKPMSKFISNFCISFYYRLFILDNIYNGLFIITSCRKRTKHYELSQCSLRKSFCRTETGQ